MAWQLDETLPLPILARRLAAQIGRNFSETISALIKHGDDVAAVARHFHAEDVEGERKAARRRAEPPAPSLEGTAFPTDGKSSPRAMPEPIFICKSESTVADPFCSSALVATSYPPPDNAAFIAEAVACGRLSHVIVETARGARAVYASPGFAKYLSGDK